MSHIVHDLIARGDARIVSQPVTAPQVRHQVESDRNFGLPPALYGATIAGYFGFLVILGTVFTNPHLAIPLAICAIIIVAGFAVPAVWTRLRGNVSAPQTLGEFETRGIMTNTGWLSAGEASTQVLILPALLLAWGIAVAVIVAIVV